MGHLGTHLKKPSIDIIVLFRFIFWLVWFLIFGSLSCCLQGDLLVAHTPFECSHGWNIRSHGPFFRSVEEVSVTAPSDINVLVPAWEAFQALIA